MSSKLRAASAAANVALLEQMRGGWRAARRAGVSDLKRVARKLRGGGARDGGRDGDLEKPSRGSAVSLTDAHAHADADADDVEPRGVGSYSRDAAYRSDAPWAWLPSMADDLRVGAAEDEPWALRLETLTSWRAHPRALRAIAVSADEASVLTVGGAGAGADASPSAVRVWSAGGPAGGFSPGSGRGSGGAIASHEAHAHAPTCAAFVPRGGVGCGAALVASADAGGALHVWRADTGETVAKLREPAASLARMRTGFGFGFGHGQATHGNAARQGREANHDTHAHATNVAANVHANTNTPTVASTFSRRLSDASPTGIVSGSPGSPPPRATSPPPPFSSTSELISSNFPSLSLGSATLDAEYYAASPRSPPASRASIPRRRRRRRRRRFSRTISRPRAATRSRVSLAPAASATMGYACAAFAPAPANEGTLAMGTSDGRVRFADVGAGRLLGAWGVGPAAAKPPGRFAPSVSPGTGTGTGAGTGTGPGTDADADTDTDTDTGTVPSGGRARGRATGSWVFWIDARDVSCLVFRRTTAR